MSNLNGDKAPRCRSCEGFGIVECPQHAHAASCSACAGTGVDRPERHPKHGSFTPASQAVHAGRAIDPGVRSGRELLTKV